MLGQGVTLEGTYEWMRSTLRDHTPEIELRYKAELVHEINALKKERNAIILGHNYMEPALYHTVTDFCGDSLQLAREAAATEAETIVFCGVEFMAETAKILSPDKTVLIPSQRAGCSLASSITAEDVRELKRRYPGVPVVAYVNTYAAVKAEVDACCTSSNAANVVSSFDSESVIFIPDEYLAGNVARDTGKSIIFPTNDPLAATRKDEGPLEKVLIGWRGRCEVHEQFRVEDITAVRQQFPDVVVLAHPECSPDVVAASDFSGSTKAMIDYVQSVSAPRYLLLTECAMGDNIAAANADKDVLRMCSVRCPHMAQITLENTRDALRHNQYEVDVDPATRAAALKSLQYMVRH